MSPVWGTVHRTCLCSVKTKKFFLGCEEPRKIFLQVAPLGPVLTLYKRPVCCVDTQLASELLSANFLFWEPGAGPEKGVKHDNHFDKARIQEPPPRFNNRCTNRIAEGEQRIR